MKYRKDQLSFKFNVESFLWIFGTGAITAGLVILIIRLVDFDFSTVGIPAISLLVAMLLSVLLPEIKVQHALRNLLWLAAAVALFFTILASQNYWLERGIMSGPLPAFEDGIFTTPADEGAAAESNTQRLLGSVLWACGVLFILSTVLIRNGFLVSWAALFFTAFGIYFEILDLSGITQFSWGRTFEDFSLLVASCSFFFTGWYADVFAKKNHGFWLNKAAIVAATAYFFEVIDQNMFSYFLFAFILSGLSLFLRRPAGCLAAGPFFYGLIDLFYDFVDNIWVFSLSMCLLGVLTLSISGNWKNIKKRMSIYFPNILGKYRPAVRTDPVLFFF